MIATGHHLWFLIPLVAFVVIRPLVWRSWGWSALGLRPAPIVSYPPTCPG